MTKTDIRTDETHRAELLRRAVAYETAMREHVERTADELLKATAVLQWGTGDAAFDAVDWLMQAARRAGHEVQPGTGFEIPQQSRSRNGWPATAHLRLHWLADRDGGWQCQVCRVDLIDVCCDDDMQVAPDGGRMIRAGCVKRLPTLDHEVPRDLGGSDHAENLRLTCQSCNSSKGAS